MIHLKTGDRYLNKFDEEVVLGKKTSKRSFEIKNLKTGKKHSNSIINIIEYLKNRGVFSGYKSASEGDYEIY